uniref:Maturase K n=1 Tax=Romanomermis culicivorax TaxID=13658 RepID=A0A915JSP8_ROMCU
VEFLNFESHAEFIVFLLTRSPLLKQFVLEALNDNLAFYDIVFEKFRYYDQIEYLSIRSYLSFLEQCFIYNELSKMSALVSTGCCLEMMHCSSSLEGLILYDNQTASPAFFDIIFHQCPNLLENLRNLRLLCIRNEMYDLLLRQGPIKRLCRRKRLLVTASTLPDVEEVLILEWIHLCRQYKSM